MPENNSEQEILGSLSGDDPLDNLIDDLYYLKSSLIQNCKFTPESSSFITQISNLLDAHPELCAPLLRWKFLEKELLYFLRANKFEDAMEIAIKVLKECKKSPDFFFTKKFLFFITEKLFFGITGKNESLGGTVKPTDDFANFKDSLPTDFIEMNTIASIDDLRSSQVKFADVKDEISCFPEEINYEIVKLIMKLVAELISIRRTATVQILYELSFFELANICICTETAVMFNSVFKDLSFPYVNLPNSSKENWIQDGLYEIQRNHFEPEILFRNKEIFSPQTVVEKLVSGVFDKIYCQCININDFADISLLDCLDLLLYKRTAYINEQLELLLFEVKDEKVFRIYRRSLESGVLPNKMYINTIIKALDNPELRREAALSLYFYMEEFDNFKLFTEDRIRKIFETLEFSCEHECQLKTEKLKIKGYTEIPKEKQTSNVEPGNESNNSFDSNEMSNHIFGNTTDQELYDEPTEIRKKSKKSILETFSEFENDFDNIINEAKRSNNYICERKRILLLIKFLYGKVKREWFYKPSYLILLTITLSHSPENRDFITEFFGNFLNFIGSESKNIAKVFLPSLSKTKISKSKEYKMEDTESDFYGIKQLELTENVSVKAEENKSGLKLNKNMIESDDE